MSNVRKHQTVSKRNYKEPDPERRTFSSLNILRVESYLFDYSSKARRGDRPSTEAERHFTDPHSKKPVVVIPSERYGVPGIPAYQIWDAYQRKLSCFGFPLPKSVCFGYRELHRLIRGGRVGGSDLNDVRLAIKQLRHTEIDLWFYHPDDEGWTEIDINLFQTVAFSGAEKGKISKIVLTLHEDLRADLNRLAYCINHSRLAGLDPIGKLLYKYIYFALCKRFASAQNETFKYTKAYARIVTDWLGGMAVRAYPKDIKRQLGSRLDALKDQKLIKSWKLDKNKGGDGYNFIFMPGQSFFTDYWNFYVAGYWFIQTCEAALGQAARDEDVEAFELVADFHRKRTGVDDLSDAFFYEQETELARSILAELSLKQAQDFNDYALAQARRTDYSPKTYTGIRHYFADYLKVRDQRAENRKKQAFIEAKQQEEKRERQLQAEYDRIASSRIENLKASLSADEIKTIEKQAREADHVQWPDGEVIESLVRIETNRLLSERTGMPSYEEWKGKLASKQKTPVSVEK